MPLKTRAISFGLASVLCILTGCADISDEESVAQGQEEVSVVEMTLTAGAQPRHRLVAWAALSHTERTPGPTSGQFIQPANGVIPPFVDSQPIPGWSGLLDNRNGTFTALPDNGFGSKANSADYVLGMYQVVPKFKTHSDGTSDPGTILNRSFIAFNDSLGLLKNGCGVDLVITADRANYWTGNGTGVDSGIPVDPSIKQQRLLTGYDFDVESFARAHDGTLWVGEEFGPYLLHFDARGTLIEEPIGHPFLKSPQHPEVLAGTATSTLAQSRGFESLAFDAQRRLLYAVPEAAPSVDALRPVPGDERVLEIFEFSPRTRQYTGRSFKYRKDGEAAANAIVIGDMTNVGPDRFVLIERDSKFGNAAEVKRLYLIQLGVTDVDGVLEKRLLIDLLNIDDPRDIGGDLTGLEANKFNMPFDSVESVVLLDPVTLGVAIDTNFPGEDGRNPGTPDSTEFVKLRFDAPIASYAPRHRHAR